MGRPAAAATSSGVRGTGPSAASAAAASGGKRRGGLGHCGGRGGGRVQADRLQRVARLAQRRGAARAQQVVGALARWAEDAARHGQHRAAVALGVADRVQRAAAQAGFGHADGFGQTGDEPVAREEGAGRAARIAGRVFADNDAAAFFNVPAQPGVGRREGLVDRGAEERGGQPVRLNGGAVGFAVQAVGQAADNDRPPPRPAPRRSRGRLRRHSAWGGGCRRPPRNAAR